MRSTTIQPVTFRLDQSIQDVPGIGPGLTEKLGRLGIVTVRDLVVHWPRRYLDLSSPRPIASLGRDETVAVEGTLQQIEVQPRIGRRKARLTAQLVDESGDRLPVVWFNQTYLVRLLKEGESVLLYGRTSWNWHSRHLNLANPVRGTKRTILPIYPETTGITSAFFRRTLSELLPRLELPNLIGEQLDSPSLSLKEAVRELHQPSSLDALELARQRIGLDELTALQFELARRRQALAAFRAPEIEPLVAALQRLAWSLPFSLTTGQRAHAWSIIQALRKSVPMNRLLQGDVGSGKTIVTLLAAVSVLESGYHVVWMAPTQVLARQLHARLAEHLKPLGQVPSLVVAGSDRSLSAQPTLWVGTHALTGLDLPPDRVGLVVVDEQQRFGVEQRRALVRSSGQTIPHLLSMTATPIPRSLALALFDQVELATLADRPAYHQPQQTRLVRGGGRREAIAVIAQAVSAGRQAFVVVPRIQGTSDSLFDESLAAVQAAYQAALPTVRIARYHGQLPAAEQQETMDAFLAGQLDLLIATSIIEVGIDVPNATAMVIEGAEQFGLAQLHQLRGRVGRGQHQGHCVVLPGPTADEEAIERLEQFARLDDGFALAELDLQLRGPGDLIGSLQSGLPQLKLARLDDTLRVSQAAELAAKLVELPPPRLDDWLAFHRTGSDGKG